MSPQDHIADTGKMVSPSLTILATDNAGTAVCSLCGRVRDRAEAKEARARVSTTHGDARAAVPPRVPPRAYSQRLVPAPDAGRAVNRASPQPAPCH